MTASATEPIHMANGHGIAHNQPAQGGESGSSMPSPIPIEPIAIVGMAMRLPGGVHSGEDFWDMLIRKRSGVCRVPPNRYNIDGFFDPASTGNRKPGTLMTDQGYFLQDLDIQQFDTSAFPISKKELERLDPQQRQLLEVTYECMENAGVTGWHGGNIGCYVGGFCEDYSDMNAKETQHRGGYRVTGYADFSLANRVSYEFDLRGPSMAIKTACSSSLVCLDIACEAILKGDCDGALVGGCNLIFSPTMMLSLTDQGVLAPSGTCKSFDASADGYGRGEAITMVYVKKLSHALRDGNPIRAVIRASSTNCDGRSQSMLTPSTPAQEALIRKTYALAGISDLSQTGLVECHGTGTATGDPVETKAVANCFGEKGVTITSVKPNVGHSEGAAGLTSVIKAVLALEHRTIPPNIYFNNPNPRIPFEEGKLHVPTEPEAWPQDRAERVSVSSFGIGGVNAHVVIDSARQFGLDRRAVNGAAQDNVMGGIPATDAGNDAKELDSKQHLLLFSAFNANAVKKYADEVNSFINNTDVSLTDLAYTLSARREHRQHRGFAVISKGSEITVSSIESVKPAPRMGWVFTGQGAQWPRMGAKLLETSSTFKATIEKLDMFLQSLPVPPKWTLENEMRKTSGVSRVHQAEIAHPLSVALQIGLVNVLRSFGLEADFVLGHSSGEMGAAYACGALSAEAAMAAALFRSMPSSSDANLPTQRKGSMAAIGLGREEVAPFLPEEGGVVVACENSQCSVTLSGDTEQVQKAVEKIKTERPDVLARFMRVEKAFHSHHMLDRGPSYEKEIQPFVASTDPRIPFYSSLTGEKLATDASLGASYWRRNMENPVLFNSALRSAMADQDCPTVLLEVGPHPALKGPIGQILRDLQRSDDLYLGSLQRDKNCDESLLNMAGQLFLQAINLDYSTICPPGQFIQDMPRYSWDRDVSHWAEPRLSYEWRFREHVPHDLLGNRISESINQSCWRNMLALEDVPWLAGHEVNTQVVFPAAGYVGMVGEALRRLERKAGDATPAFQLRNVSIAAAMVLENFKTTEILTSVVPMTQDPNEKSPWYAFTINTLDGDQLVRHCSGEARVSTDCSSTALNVPEEIQPLPRQVDEHDWYRLLKSIGFNYTGLFRGLQDISVATVKTQAMASVPIKDGTGTRGGCGTYAVHPAIMDQCFQLTTVAAYHGLRRNCRQLAVPTFIDEIIVAPALEDCDLDVRAGIYWMDQRGSFVGDLVAYAGPRSEHRKPVLSFKGFRTASLGGAESASNQTAVLSQFEWRPHAGFVKDLSSFMRPRPDTPNDWLLLEELVLLCMLDHKQRQPEAMHSNIPQYMVKFFAWMDARIAEHRAGDNQFVSAEVRLWELDESQRRARIDTIVDSLKGSPCEVFTTAITRLLDAFERIVQGQTHPLHVLLEDEVLYGIYAVGDSLDYDQLLQLLAHTNPRLRVLEVGAGTGGTTRKVLRSLTSQNGERMFEKYSYTDISSGFLAHAKETFGSDGIEYGVLDIERDPAEQGFPKGDYDLIIAANVVHATPSLGATLRRLRSLLRPGGRLFLQELCPDVHFISYVWGFLPGWWLGEKDGRATAPYVSPARWSQELVEAGFQEPDGIQLDCAAPFQSSAGIIAAVPVPRTKPAPSRVTLLCHGIDAPYVKETTDHLAKLGIPVDLCAFGEALPESQDIISLLDLHDPTVHGMKSERTFKDLVALFQSVSEGKQQVVWALSSAQVACEDPRGAMMLGMARTARSEFAAKLFTVEVENNSSETNRAAEVIIDVLLKGDVDSVAVTAQGMDPDWEYSLVKGEVLVPRLHWQTSERALTETAIVNEEFNDGEANSTQREILPVRQVSITTPGLLHTMGWRQKAGQALAEGEVLVRTKAIGLNFRDVLVALGVLNISDTDLGFDGCGIVQDVGPNVNDLSVGDRIIYMRSGGLSTFQVVPQILCVKIDKSIDFVPAAGLGCIFSTAIRGLIDLAHLQQGQTVLIHSACGGVGLAAIQIAQMVGAEIFCTVGGEEKVEYLHTNHAIPRSHIFTSRDASFLGGIMRATNNRGVDVVLNSLSGDLLHASWKCVAEFGTMVEIGKRDFQRRSKLAMEAFEMNRTFVGLDIGSLVNKRPEEARKLLERVVQFVKAGTIKPIAVAKMFEAAEVRDAFRFMQLGRHIGKIVVRMPDDPSSLEFIKAKAIPVLRPDRNYLLVGGLGGLGRAIATWMVENGARHLTFLSRSAKETPELAGFLKDIRSQGCEAYLVAGSVSNRADVEKAISAAPCPVAGVLNMVMVLQDVSLSDMTFAEWSPPVDPKVQGTWNMHEALLPTKDLDFFILYSSYSGIVGQWGQANYTSANTFLDAFVGYRHSLGLPASVIDVGLMDEVGYLAKNTDIRDRLTRIGMQVLKEKDLLDAMTLAITRSRHTPAVKPGAARKAVEAMTRYINPSQILLGFTTTMPLDLPTNRVVWKHDARMSIYYNINGRATDSAGPADGAGGSASALKELLTTASSNPDILNRDADAIKFCNETIATAVATTLCNFLIRKQGSIPIEGQSFEALGIDSLVAMELRNWIRQQLGVEKSVFTIVRSQSLMHLADDLRTALNTRFRAA